MRRGGWQGTGKQADSQSVRQAGRQTEAARKHGKGRLTNCFCSLWKGAARHGLVWALTFRRVNSDPRRKGGRREGRWREGERNGKRKKINGGVRETLKEEDRRERRKNQREEEEEEGREMENQLDWTDREGNKGGEETGGWLARRSIRCQSTKQTDKAAIGSRRTVRDKVRPTNLQTSVLKFISHCLQAWTLTGFTGKQWLVYGSTAA